MSFVVIFLFLCAGLSTASWQCGIYHQTLSSALQKTGMKDFPSLSCSYWLISDRDSSLYRVRTGPGKPGKSWNFTIAFSRTGKSWKKSTGPGKFWKYVKLN